jgi:hypothetical protein
MIFTLNDHGSKIIRTHVIKKHFKNTIFYLCNLCKCLQFFYKLYIGGEHQIHVVQINSKNHNFKKLKNYIKLN